MKNIFVINIFLCSLAWKVSSYGKVEWRYLDQDKLFCDALQGAVLGGDDGKPLYVCRAWHKRSRWVPGKLFYDDGDYFCLIEEHIEQHVYRVSRDPTRVQVLFAPCGCLTWVPKTSRRNLPSNAVLGGHHPAGDEAHVCRHQDKEGRVIIGKYWTYDGKCYYPMDGFNAEGNNVEILTVSMLGMQKCKLAYKNMTKI